MPNDTPDDFRQEVEQRLRQLDNPRLSAAFAVRAALYALPALAIDMDNPFLYYWHEQSQEKNLFSILRAIQIAYYEVITNSNLDSASRIAAIVAVTASGEAHLRPKSTANAVEAAEIAIVSAASINPDILKTIKEEVKNTRSHTNDVVLYLNKPVFSSPNMEALQYKFCAELYGLNRNFDYWADWLKKRFKGIPIDIEELKNNVLLPEEILAQTIDEINGYLKQICTGEAEKDLSRVRAIFIGNGEAGKTSLIRALNNKPVVEGVEPMTPGIEISEWLVPDSPLTAHFWDFGGQVIAHATHQFFLRARCVYVLVLNARSTDSNPNQQAEYWLEYIRAFGADAPVLLVGNKCDLTPVYVDEHRLRETHPNIQGFYPLSCTGYKGHYRNEFTRFYIAFAEQLRAVGHIQPRFPASHFQLIETLRERSRKDPFLKKTVFERLCKEHEVAPHRRESLMDLMEKLGEIIHFPELEWLDSFLLNPRWLTYGVYPLLYSERLKQQCGRLSRNDVAEILRGHKVTDNDGHTLRYPPDRQHLLLEAMAQFQLCYPAPDAPHTWIVPDLLPSDQPDNRKLAFERQGALRFDFSFTSFLPRHVLSMFIVAHYQDIRANQAWQHGVRLHSARWQSDALVLANYPQRTLSLWLRGNGAYFSVLYDSLAKILERMPKLRYRQLLYLPETARLADSRRLLREDDPPHADFEDLLEYQAAGEQTYRCKYGTYDLLEVLKLMPKPKQPVAVRETIPSPKPVNNAWLNGSFMLVLFVVVMTTLGVLAAHVPILALPLVLIGGVIFIGIMGAFQLRNDARLSQKNFLTLMLETYKRLPLLRKGKD